MLRFRVTLDAAQAETVSVRYATANGCLKASLQSNEWVVYTKAPFFPVAIIAAPSPSAASHPGGSSLSLQCRRSVRA